MKLNIPGKLKNYKNYISMCLVAIISDSLGPHGL